jgi:hypothetical protein
LFFQTAPNGISGRTACGWDFGNATVTGYSISFRHNGKQWGTLQKEYWESRSTGATWLYQINFSLPNESALAPRISADAGQQATLMAKSTVSDLSKRCGKQDSKYGK